MFQSISCQLCINICNGHRSLYDEDGRRNEVYALTEKYFSPLLLNTVAVDQSSVICMECWRHMFEFSSFQQSVLLAHKMSVVNKQPKTEAAKGGLLDGVELCTKPPTKSIVADVRCRNKVIPIDTDSRGSKASTSSFSHYRANDSCSSVIADQPPGAVVKSEIEYVDIPRAVVKSEIESPPHDRGNDSSSDDHPDHHSEAIVKSEVEYLEYVFTDVPANRAVLTKNIAATSSQNRGIVSDNEVSRDSDIPDEQWEDEFYKNEIADTAGADSDWSNETFSSNDETPLAEYTAMDEAKWATPLAPTNVNLAAGLDGNPQSDSEPTPAKRRKNFLYSTNLNRPQTAQEYDDFIAQWRANLECAICSETCSSFSLLLQHFDQLHPTEKCYILCCQHKFYSRFEIEKHIHFHTEETPFKCDTCFIRFSNEYNLELHMRRLHSGKHKEDPFKCPKCSRRCRTKSTLEKHLQDVCDTSKPVHTCSECGKVFKTLMVLKRHNRQYHSGSGKITIIKCTICDKVFQRNGNLNDHMASHHAGKPTHTCLFCPKTYMGRGPLYVHLNRKHSKEWEERKKEKAEQKAANLNCTTCGKVYRTSFALREHQAMHAGKALYNCPHCSKTFIYSSNLASHLKRKHAESVNVLQTPKREVHLGSSDIVTLKCTICGQIYDNPLSLRAHMDSHEDQSLFTCMFCPKEYVYRAALYVHLRRKHLKEWAERKKEAKNAKLSKRKEKKPHKCSACDNIYTSRHTLREHQAKHTGVALYTCTYCSNFKTNYKTHFRAHLQKKHSEKMQKNKKKG